MTEGVDTSKYSEIYPYMPFSEQVPEPSCHPVPGQSSVGASNTIYLMQKFCERDVAMVGGGLESGRRCGGAFSWSGDRYVDRPRGGSTRTGLVPDPYKTPGCAKCCERLRPRG